MRAGRKRRVPDASCSRASASMWCRPTVWPRRWLTCCRMPRRSQLAWHGGSSPSRGTAKTMLEGIPQGGAIRKDGVITEVPLGWKTAEIPFNDKTRLAVTIPWGDVFDRLSLDRHPEHRGLHGGSRLR